MKRSNQLQSRALAVWMRAFGAWIGIVGLGLPGCGEPPPQPPEPVRPAKLLVVGDETGQARAEYPGVIQAALRAEMAFEVNGRMIEFPVIEGQEAVQGEVLGRLDDRDYRARLDSAKAELRKAEADYQRGKSIFDEDPGAISKATLDTYRKALEVAQSHVQVAEKAMEETVLRAPFDGRVARKLVDDFANVRAKDPVLIFQDDRNLEIRVNIPERDVVRGSGEEPSRDQVARLQPQVVVTSIPDHSFPAAVKEFAAAADPETRTFAATLRFQKPDDALILPGMTAKVLVKRQRGESDVFWIPSHAAVADDQGKAYVWVIDKGSMTARRASVELGRLAGDEVEVRTGLTAGDTIAISGVHELREGMRVRPYESKVPEDQNA